MSRLVWNMGFAGLGLACATALWLRQPVELPAHAEPVVPRLQERSPEPLTVRATPSPRPVPPVPQAPSSARPAEPPRERPVHGRRTPPALRLQVVNALRARYPDADSRREAVLAELMATGESQEPWTAHARDALARWHAQVESDVLPVSAEPARCFAAGCVARVTFPDTESFQESFRRTADLRLGESGAHLQLPPERRASGEVVAAWLVLRPAATP